MSYKKDVFHLRSLLLTLDEKEYESLIEDLHPADILDVIRQFKDDRVDILNRLPAWMIAYILDEADDKEKYELLSVLPRPRKKEIIGEMSSDELTDMVGSITPEEAKEIFTNMDSEDADELKELLTYNPETAGGIMAKEFLSVTENMTVEETLEYLRKEAPGAETTYYIYVLDENQRLKGVLSLRNIVISDLKARVSDIMHERVISVPVTMDQEEVGHLFEKYGFLTMPVVDDKDKMLGIITFDDVMNILREETTEDIYRLGGVQEGEKITGTVTESVKRRLPWLFINLLTAILASSTVSLFEGTIARVVTLATFMPIVAGMGGNTGTQTLTIIVRGLALGELTFENAKKVLLKEIGVGVSTGISIGVTVALLGFFWAGKPVFGLVIGLSMLLNMTAATLAGFLVPLILKKLHVDPALASAVFVTTVTDVLGFFFFLGLATVFISYLT